jgi:hypothetical protein
MREVRRDAMGCAALVVGSGWRDKHLLAIRASSVALTENHAIIVCLEV